jgi:endonuclease G
VPAQPSHAVGEGDVNIELPLTITVRLGRPASTAGDGNGHGNARPAVTFTADAAPSVDTDEAVSIDPNYSNRAGYNANFLGTGARRVPLPELSPALKSKAAVNQQASGADRHVLPYHHFSVVMNRERKMAFYTAVNIDGRVSFRIKRETDRWIKDPRLGKNEQTGESLYAGNPLDRGHLVRRLDPAWGDSFSVAKVANDDTFHFTNCTPQHAGFNQSHDTWAGLEDYILNNADKEDFKVSVFTGPVLRANDPAYRDVQLPRQFWKVVVMVKAGGKLSATAYLLSQAALLHDLEEAFAFGPYKTFQVTIKRIESLTGLNFGNLKAFDPKNNLEAETADEIKSYGDLAL